MLIDMYCKMNPKFTFLFPCVTGRPSRQPSQQPIARPTMQPSRQPSRQPSSQPTKQPINSPTGIPLLFSNIYSCLTIQTLVIPYQVIQNLMSIK